MNDVLLAKGSCFFNASARGQTRCNAPTGAGGTATVRDERCFLNFVVLHKQLKLHSVRAGPRDVRLTIEL